MRKRCQNEDTTYEPASLWPIDRSRTHGKNILYYSICGINCVPTFLRADQQSARERRRGGNDAQPGRDERFQFNHPSASSRCRAGYMLVSSSMMCIIIRVCDDRRRRRPFARGIATKSRARADSTNGPCLTVIARAPVVYQTLFKRRSIAQTHQNTHTHSGEHAQFTCAVYLWGN